MAEKRVFLGTGRRKSSVAQVKMVPGKGKITVNGRDVRDFFPYETNVMDLKQPLVATGTEESFDIEEAEKLEKQLRKGEFDLNDYLAQLKQIKKMGSFSSILKMIPGLNKFKDLKVDDKEFTRIEAIISSMTDKERRNPKILNGSRRIRIAKGSGTKVQDINKFINSYEATQKMMKKMQSNKGGMRKMLKGMDVSDLKNLKI